MIWVTKRSVQTKRVSAPHEYDPYVIADTTPRKSPATQMRRLRLAIKSLMSKRTPKTDDRERDCPDSPSKGSVSSGSSAAGNARSQRSFVDRCAVKSDFTLLRNIGSGSFGTVFLAIHKDTRQLIALKEIKPPDNVFSSKLYRIAVNESNILEDLNHPFIVKLFFVFPHNQLSMFLGMEYVPGRDLWTLMYERRKAPMCQSAAVFYIAQLFLAIEYLHSKKGIIFRDIKSENIVLDEMGYIRLVDFGCATRLAPGELLKLKCGTMQCLAPEVISDTFRREYGGGYGFASEYWSIGVLLYELLVGRPPFVYDPAKETAQQFAARLVDPRTVVVVPAHVSTTAASLITGLLTKSPLARVNDATVFRRHALFKKLDWGALLDRRLPAPWRPAAS